MNKYESTLRTLEKISELNPEDSSLFDHSKHQAGILLCMKNYKEVLKVIEKARQLLTKKAIFPNL